MKKLTPILAFLILIIFALPLISQVHAAEKGPFDLIVCDGIDTKCDFNSLMTLFYRLVNAMIKIATVITAVALIFMGFKLLTAGGNPGMLSELRKRAGWILVGYVCILAAWLIVYTILKVLASSDYIILGNP